LPEETNFTHHSLVTTRVVVAQAKSYWQHTGEIISSRLAESVLQSLSCSDIAAADAAVDAEEIIKNRICEVLQLPHDADVLLTVSGMAAIFAALRLVLEHR